MTQATTTMRGFIEAILGELSAHEWNAPIRQIGYREPQTEYSETGEPRIVTPALLLHIGRRQVLSDSDYDAIGVPGEGARVVDCEIHCILGTQTPDLPIELIELSEQVTAVVDAVEDPPSSIRGNRWGLARALEHPTDIVDDVGVIDLHGIDSRVVRWRQIVYTSRATT